MARQGKQTDTHARVTGVWEPGWEPGRERGREGNANRDVKPVLIPTGWENGRGRGRRIERNEEG